MGQCLNLYGMCIFCALFWISWGPEMTLSRCMCKLFIEYEDCVSHWWYANETYDHNLCKFFAFMKRTD